MTLEAAFLQDIIASPEDDVPRLVYADWLQEHGQADRAEFIRVQCALARTAAGDNRRASLERLRTELWEAHGAGWRAALPTPASVYVLLPPG